MRWMTVTLAALCAAVIWAQEPQKAEKPEKKEAPRIDVVFVLDTTGSMSGMIASAKKKIWEIANKVLEGDPRPKVRFGLVAYRDKGDKYVTRKFDLTEDIDAVYKELQTYRAAGGGDGPEHVNKALHVAVNEMGWDMDKKTLRMIFLVGDAPPHEDYDDGFDWKKACRTAAERGIIINTISYGGWNEDHWRKIAKAAEGKFVLIGGRSRVAAVAGMPRRPGFMGGGRGGAFGRRRKAGAPAAPGEAKLAGAMKESCDEEAPGADPKLLKLLEAIVAGDRKIEDVKADDLPKYMTAKKEEKEWKKELAKMADDYARYKKEVADYKKLTGLLDELVKGEKKLDDVKAEDLPESFAKKKDWKSELKGMYERRKEYEEAGKRTLDGSIVDMVRRKASEKLGVKYDKKKEEKKETEGK